MAAEFPGVSHYRDRHGKLRWRYRKDGFTTNLGTEYGSPEFLRRYTAAVKGERLTASVGATGRTSQAPSGSLSHLISDWYKSSDFLGLAESTQANYRYIAERLREAYGSQKIVDLDRATIKKIMAKKADRPHSANHDLRLLRFLLDHAIDRGLVESNPARTVKKLATRNPDGYHTWTETEITKFYKKWGPGSVAYLAVTIMLHTGASRGDAVLLGPGNRHDGRIQYRRKKMLGRDGVLVDIPEHPRLTALLDSLPIGVETFLQTAQGPRSANGLGTSMRKWANAAGVPECTSHGLRKACARRLAEAGATPHEIMSVTGHKTLSEVERYTKAVARAGLADRALERINTEEPET